MRTRLSRRRGGAFAFGWVMTLAGCVDLPLVPRDVCGNHIVEETNGEDCDGSEKSFHGVILLDRRLPPDSGFPLNS